MKKSEWKLVKTNKGRELQKKTGRGTTIIGLPIEIRATAKASGKNTVDLRLYRQKQADYRLSVLRWWEYRKGEGPALPSALNGRKLKITIDVEEVQK